MAIFSNFKNACKGATSIEYAVIASMLSIVILAALIIVGTKNKDNYTGVAGKVSDAMATTSTSG